VSDYFLTFAVLGVHKYYNRRVLYGWEVNGCIKIKGGASFVLLLAEKGIGWPSLTFLFPLCPFLLHPLSFRLLLLRSFLLLCLSLQGLHLQSYFLLNLLYDLVIIKLLPLLKLRLTDTQWMIILVDPILPLPLTDLNLLDDTDKVVAELLQNALQLQLLQLDHNEVELAGIPDVLLHLGRQHLQVREDVVSNDCRQGHGGEEDDEGPAEDDSVEDVGLVGEERLDLDGRSLRIRRLRQQDHPQVVVAAVAHRTVSP
jgi:hypothetical protein